MHYLTRPRMGLLLSFVLGVGCTIIVHVTGILGLDARSLWGSVTEADFSWLPQGPVLPSIGVGALASMIAVVACGVAAVAWRKSSKARGSATVAQTAIEPPQPAPNPIRSPVAEDVTTQTQAELEQQLTDLLKVVVGYLARNSAYSAAVVHVQDQLTPNAGIDRVRQLIEALISQNAEALSDARNLRGQLESAREQTSDIRERLHTAERLTKLDALTSVANRRSLDEFLESQIAQSHQDQSPLCVVMTDIDNFKQVNDRYGHQMGDDVLKSFAHLLQSCSRSTDLVARFGGEEFTLVLPRTPMGNAYQIADRVRRVLDGGTMTMPDSTRVLAKVTASFGIAEIREDEVATQLLSRADRMLYEAKKSGRNLVVTDSLDRPVQDWPDRSSVLENPLKAAS